MTQVLPAPDPATDRRTGPVVLARSATRAAGTPARVPARHWSAFDDESLLAVACAEQLTDAELPVPAGTGPRLGICWATATAGGPDYAQVCLDTATYGPGGATPFAGPRSAFNGPAAALSICLGARGPVHTVTGGVVAGLNALVEGLAALRGHEVDQVLIGGSVGAPLTDAGTVAAGPVAAAAVCLERGASGWQVVDAIRVRPAPAQWPEDLDDLLAARLPTRLPAGSVVLLVDDLALTGADPAGPTGSVEPLPRSLTGRPGRTGHSVLRLRHHLGDLGPAAVPAALALLAGGSVASPTGLVALVVLTRARDAGTVVLQERRPG